MRLRVRALGIQAGGRPIVVLGDESAGGLGVHSLDRVEVRHAGRHLVAIVNIALSFPADVVGVYDEVWRALGLDTGDEVEVSAAEKPESLRFIQEKILGRRLDTAEIKMIVKDVVERHLSDVELTSFVTALHIRGISMDETEALSRAMVETGGFLKLDRRPVFDKHSIGGVPGDKTSILVVPIVAAAGHVIPKTSSRAVTSPAGTADRVEVLCPVELSAEEIRRVVEETNACLAWGGALDLAPADDLFIQVEYPLAIDPLLLPSIMSKKKAIGADYVVIDIPAGRGAKVKTIGEAHNLANDFLELGRRLDMQVECAITYGEQPVGRAVGPALEAKEALETLMGGGPPDLREKATTLAGILLEMAGHEDGRQVANELLRTGKAEKKLREIIAAQGGDPEVKPESIHLGKHVERMAADRSGRVLWINNGDIVQVARAAGAPKDKGAGLLLTAKIGDEVSKGAPLFEIYAERAQKLEEAFKAADELKPIGLERGAGQMMLIDRVPAKAIHEKAFLIER